MITITCVVSGAHSYAATCPRKWLNSKDCRFRDKSFHVQVWQDKISANDVRNRDMVTLPYVGKQVEWRQVRLRKIAARRFIEIELWSAPDAQTGIQAKKWLFYEWRSGRLRKELDVSLQKRKQLADGQYLYDPALKRSLELDKTKIIWRCGQQAGVLEAKK